MGLDQKNLSDKQREFLVFTLINGNKNQRFQASNVIQKFIDDPWLNERVKSILNDCLNPEILPYLLNCKISDKISIKEKNNILKKYKNTHHYSVYFFIVKLKLQLNIALNSTHHQALSF